MTGLAGKTALVTGASRGIGRAVAERLAKAGALVLAHYGSADAEAEALASATAAAGGKLALLKADLADSAAIARLAASASEQAANGFDILVHNAGISLRAAFAETTQDHLDSQYAINMRAPFLLTQALAPTLNDGGSIVFVSSTAAQRNFPALVGYAMGKAGIEILTTYLAAEFGPRDIAVNAVAPGAVETDMQPGLQLEERRALVMAQQALQRIAQPDDIAEAIVMLAARQPRWMTGAVLPVSGGTRL